jgi:hypothetical protein
MKIKFVKIIGLLLLASFLFFPDLAIAQDDPFGVNDLNLALEQNIEPKSAIVNIINIVLGFLGLIAVIIIIYAGFIWMMSGGEAEKIDKAKKMLKNGLIGLVIILLSWGIVTYIFSQIIGIGGGGGGTAINPGTGFNIGYGALGNCTLESVYPAPGQKEVARNTIIMMTFKEELDPLSVCVDSDNDPCECDNTNCRTINSTNFKIYPSADNTKLLTNALASITTDKKTIVIAPQEYLGSASGKMDYTVNISGIKKADGDLMFKTCANDVYFEWEFEVSDKLDLDPPRIVKSGVFPPPDNSKDDKEITESIAATGSITVLECPNIYKQAEIVSYSTLAGSNSIESIEVKPNYSLSHTDLTVVIHSDNQQAQLKDADDNLLGSVQINNNIMNFPDYFSLEVEDHAAGNSWEIEIKSRVLADNLVIGSESYVFADNDNGNKIEVPAPCDLNTVASNIHTKLASHPDLSSSVNNSEVSLEAIVKGAAANNIFFSTTNNSAFEFVPMSGGVDQTVSYTTNDKADQPMNSVIQINFNEAINPITSVGPASWISDSSREYIKVFNKGGANDGDSCDFNKDCKSYNCEAGVCINDYLSGEFRISNSYKTIEFISDWECGVNGCGEKVYCLPADANLEVQFKAADLHDCDFWSDDCSTKQPFSVCQQDTDLEYDTCQDSDSNNYPLAHIGGINGIVDTALNSFDGNRSNYSDGPFSFFNENSPNNNGDNYKWSFWINDVINLEPPIIEAITPEQGVNEAERDEEIRVEFDSLMQSSSLRTGSVLNNGIRHQYLNLQSLSGAVGYWISSVNLDSDSNGVLDQTIAYINHTNLPPSVTWQAQVGSGVRNIYQNCFKPSEGPDCSPDETEPSCCYGEETDTLINGSCP